MRGDANRGLTKAVCTKVENRERKRAERKERIAEVAGGYQGGGGK